MQERKNESENDIEPTGEDNVDETAVEELEQTASQKLKQLREKLTACENQRRSLHEELQRTKADYLNAKKRVESRVNETAERQTIDFIERLLPLYDSFEMAMQDKKKWNAIDPMWRMGVEGIYKELQSLLASFQTDIIRPISEPFDPQLHEAVDSEPVTDKAQNDLVTAVLQAGVTRTTDDKTIVIRPARVRVGRYEVK